MKNCILFSSLMIATALTVASCQTDKLSEERSSSPLVINAVAKGVGTPASKAEMAYKYDLLWNKGDQIYLRKNSTHATATLLDGEDTPDGTFACSSNPFRDGDEVEAIYPTSLVQDDRLRWPIDQTLDTEVPMYCKGTITGTGAQNFAFTSLGCVLQIVYNTNTLRYHLLKSIRIEDGEKTMSGTFIIDDEGKAVITAKHKAGINLNLGESGIQMQDEMVGFFNIVVPAGTYSHLKLTFTNTDGQEYVMTSTTPLEFKHNGVARLTISTIDSGFSKKYYKGSTRAIINGDPVDIEWMKLWDNGPKFAKYNIGVTDANIESFGGLYFWGSTIDRDTDTRNYNKVSSSLTGNDDTATALWGKNWRMPTHNELVQLEQECNVEIVTMNGKNFMKIMPKDAGYAKNILYFPLAGHTEDGKFKEHVVGDYSAYNYSAYWSSTAQYSSAFCLQLKQNEEHPNGYIRSDYSGPRNYGLSVRAVVKE